MNLLASDCIRVALSAGPPAVASLPATIAALMRDDVESFPALRPHQRQAWHAFLAQVGAMALLRAGLDTAPADADTWLDLLRALTPEFPDDAPWCLVSPPDKPALLQPPLPDGRLEVLKNTVETPDGLDMLVTAKNHDLKAEVMRQARPDDWLFALVTLQTMEGFLGAGNYGISRMNGGFANRAAVSIAPAGRPGRHLRRDMERLVAIIHAGSGVPFPQTGTLGLTWLVPWDGATALRPAQIHPLYIDVCRRVRLVLKDGRIAARTIGSKGPRIEPIPGGRTGDPWAPVVHDKTDDKVFTASADGFGYRRMVDLMFPDAIMPSPLQRLAPTDDEEGLELLARALVRGQGKTEGLHERRVPLSRTIAMALGRTKDADPVARAARDRVELAGLIQGKVLNPALLALFENGPDELDFRDKGAGGRAATYLRQFDEAVDRDFFPRLWEEFEDGAERDAVRARWVRDLLRLATSLLDTADRAMSKAVWRRYKARAKADAILAGAPRRNPKISPYLAEAR